MQHLQRPHRHIIVGGNHSLKLRPPVSQQRFHGCPSALLRKISPHHPFRVDGQSMHEQHILKCMEAFIRFHLPGWAMDEGQLAVSVVFDQMRHQLVHTVVAVCQHRRHFRRGQCISNQWQWRKLLAELMNLLI